MDKFDILSASYESLVAFIMQLGEKEYRAGQIFGWMHRANVLSFGEMTNLPLSLRQKLSELAGFPAIRCVNSKTSKETTKHLFEIANHNIIEQGGIFIEAVLMEYKHGYSVCLSTQAGCRMGCDFCASGITGLDRNLTTGEMLAQLYTINRELLSHGHKGVSNIVLMGIGEPLDNYDAAIGFIKLANDPRGLNIGQRHITLSTCGIVPKIYALLSEGLQITLAISLHAPNDSIRRAIMPIAKAYNMDELLAAAKAYGEHRRVSFEYIMIDGVNDKAEHAEELATRLRGISGHVNLIPMNRVIGKPYNKPNMQTINKFAKTLSKYIETTVRRELGSDISAACGQLRSQAAQTILLSEDRI